MTLLTAAEMSTVKCILRKWEKLHGKLPRDYLCFDTETTGFNFSWDKAPDDQTECGDDLIVELGFCAVVDSTASFYQSHMLDWTRHPLVEEEWLRYKLNNCRERMAERGLDYRFTYELLQQNGKDPIKVIDWYRRRLLKARRDGMVFVGHNICGFDARIFAQTTDEWLGNRFEFGDNEIVDTAAIEKASQVGMEPFADETMAKYFRRVMATPWADVKYTLDRDCVPKYELDKKYDISTEESHTAGFDAMLCHLLLEEFRSLVDD